MNEEQKIDTPVSPSEEAVMSGQAVSSEHVVSSQVSTQQENSSGQGKLSQVPDEIKGWNWGAFLLNWIWGIGNNTFIALLMFIPFIGWVFAIVLGLKGNEWAWKNKKWESVEDFKRIQKLWTKWALISIGIFIVFFILLFTILWKLTSVNVNIASEFYKDVSNKNIDAAYLLLVQGDSTSKETFKKFIESHPKYYEIVSTSFSGRSIEGNKAILKGSATLTDGSKLQITVEEEKIGGSWKITSLEGVPKSAEQHILYNKRPATVGNFTFPTAKYSDFSLATTSTMLNPKTATPLVEEYGTPHIEIVKDVNGYSTTKLSQLGVVLNIPFGWSSMGGFDTMERIDFFPASSTRDIENAFDKGTSIDLGVKILDSYGTGATDMHGVISMLDKHVEKVQQVTTKEIDEKNHIFIMKIDTVNNNDLKNKSSSYSIYIQSPIPDSTVWVEIDMRAPKDQFEKYLGLLGLVYNDIDIDWDSLDAYTVEKNKTN